VLASNGLMGQLDALHRLYRDNALLALTTSGYTPIPYMLYTMMAGASELSMPVFVTGSLMGRALKYLPIATLAFVFGPAVHRVLRRFGWAAVVVVAVLLLTVVLMRAWTG
jgi:membrane protein YqaA with SNARE-associated domain